jgi:dimethylaniline monooxygenase (N-oxide forming)
MSKVCIIGAGPSGLAAAKVLKENNISFDCFEKGSKIGGVWRYKNDNGLSAAYKSLHINTNRMIMAYSDFPMPESYPMFPHHTDIVTYFERYAEHFGILSHFIFNTTVTQIDILVEGFLVHFNNLESKKYEKIIVANGHHWNPRMPNPAFTGHFTGEAIHSHDYKEVEQVVNKNLLIVGIGNSAVDIACEAARTHSGNVVISSRSGAYIVPNWIWSLPFDSLANPLTAKLPLWMQRKLLGLTLWLARGKQEDFGVPKPNRPLLSEHPTLSQDLLNLSGRGLIKFKPDIERFEGKEVFFKDGSSQSFDLIIYATGYKVTFPFLKQIPAFDVEETNDIRLYKKVIHPDYENLYFVGLLQPLGAIMPLAEIQAKWIANLINKKAKLPSNEIMKKEIEKDTTKLKVRYKTSARHTLQVDFHAYKAELEKELK